MCAVCVAIEQNKLTYLEAKKALSELIKTDLIDSEHVYLVADIIEENLQG